MQPCLSDLDGFPSCLLPRVYKLLVLLIKIFFYYSQSKLERLNEIVWPEIWRLAQEKIQEAHSKGFGVCVMDAAVMLKAGWDKYVHEIWVTIVPEKEVIYIFFQD